MLQGTKVQREKWVTFVDEANYPQNYKLPMPKIMVAYLSHLDR